MSGPRRKNPVGLFFVRLIESVLVVSFFLKIPIFDVFVADPFSYFSNLYHQILVSGAVIWVFCCVFALYVTDWDVKLLKRLGLP